MPATKTAVELWSEYRKDWEAALNPCVMCLLEKCPESELPALHALFDAYMEDDHATPPYSPVQSRRLHEKITPMIDRVMNDPAVIAEQDQISAAWRDRPWWQKTWRRSRMKVRWWWITRPRPFRKKPWE